MATPRRMASGGAADEAEVGAVGAGRDLTVLIPAAGRLADSGAGLSNASGPAMTPVAGRPVIQWTMDYLRSLGLRRFRVAIPARGLLVEEFIECTFGGDCEIEFLVPSRDGGPGLTVKELADGTITTAALVVLGDTHFTFADPGVLASEEPFVLVDEVDESYRWCIADSSPDGVLKALLDKQPDLPTPLDALIGVYYFPDASVLREAADDAVEATPDRTEISDILARVMERQPVLARPAGHWLDCGNPDRQAVAQRVLLQQRAFNELSVDATLGTITKRSRHVEKFIDEINYLRLLPDELAVLFPRVLSYSAEWDDPSLTLEFYGYPTLAELFVFADVDAGTWHRVFSHLAAIVGAFRQWRRPVSAQAIRAMYTGKARERLAGLQEPRELAALVQHPGEVTINGVRVANLPGLWDRLEREVDGLAGSAVGSVIHGDLCLSNVLYDLRSSICKFVDPRGSFGQPGIFGDLRYDVAKLYHSVHGRYDFITADLFDLELDGTEVRFEIRNRPYHDRVRDEFERAFFPEFERRDILLLTGLIFVGLPTLHYDHPRRQAALYVRGLQLLHEALNGDEA